MSNHSSRSDRIRRLRNLVVMAMADGYFAQKEVALIADRCSELELGELELQQAIRYGLDDDAALHLPSDRETCEALIVDLVRMMAADGVLEESEKRLFALAAAKMNIETTTLNVLISRALKEY